MVCISILSIPVALAGVSAVVAQVQQQPPPVTTAAASAASPFSDAEAAFLDVPRAASARASLHFITRTPHVAGTAGDRLMAEFVSTGFLQAGIPDVTTFDLTVSLNYPRSPPQLELVEPKGGTASGGNEHEQQLPQPPHADDYSPPPPHRLIYRATLSEDLLDAATDDTTDTWWRNHTFHGYGFSGSASAHLVYANYGRPEDFAILDAAGVSVKGRIVLVRYGRCLRGLKVRNAEDRGAVGVLIYSDPADDGYGRGDTYPAGPWRPPSGIQRGTVHFSSQCPGDPRRTDARYAAVLNVTVAQLCGVRSSEELIPRVPSLPLGYGDALPLFRNMGGPVAADVPGAADFAGGLAGLTYRLGPSRGVVNMRTDHEDVVTTIPNVVAVIPGTLPPDRDQPVLLGNHRDAWVYGAADPNSGTATLLEVARGLGRLYSEHGWRPLRTIYLLSWSGEEYGLLGSTGWAELNAPVLRRALAYINCDTVVSGDKLKVSASPSLASLWRGVMDDLSCAAAPVTGGGGYCAERHFLRTFDDPPHGDVRDANSRRRIPRNDETPSGGGGDDDDDDILTLGSGSDYAVFLDHLGIPSIDFSFGKRAAMYGQYHSVYDSFAWMDKFGGVDGKPGSAFEIMEFSAKIWGLLAMRLATAEVVPLDHIGQGRALGRYTAHIEEQTQDGTKGMDLRNLTEAVVAYQKAAAALQVMCSSLSRGPRIDASSASAVDECNERLGLTERKFLVADGLPGRPWFKHCLQAPGLDLGYGSEAFPGVQQALNDGDYRRAQEQVEVTAERIRAAAENLNGNGGVRDAAASDGGLVGGGSI